MLKSQDFLILMKLLANRDQEWNIRRLSQELGLSYANTYAAVGRLREGRLITRDLGPSSPQVKSLLLNSAPFFFPPHFLGPAKGFATSYAAPPLSNHILQGHALPPVIAHASGLSEGVALEPINEAVPNAIARDDRLRRWVTLFDALRSGRARERAMARQSLQEAIGDE